MLKDRRTFEIMEPGQVGAGSTLVLGKLSGRHALRDRLEQMGYRLDGEELQRAFVRFKGLADRKRDVTDRDLEAIVADELHGAEETFHLEHLQVSCGTNLRATATVRMMLSDGVSHEAVSTGDGPVDATYRAIDMLVQVKAELEEFAIQAITEGMDAVGEVTVRLRQDGALSAGHGADTDILVAAAKAYVHALNRLTTRISQGPRITPEQIAVSGVPVGVASAAT
jgi:2-isopropylmalate synthase